MTTGRQLLERLRAMKNKVVVISLALQDPKLKPLPKVLAFVTVAYAMSPIDLIPDFIPILGMLDDLIILPLLIAATLKAIPADIYRNARELSESGDVGLAKRWLFVPVFIGVWVIVLIGAVRLVLRIRSGAAV